MSVVYIVTSGCNYEGGGIDGVYAARELAEKHLKVVAKYREVYSEKNKTVNEDGVIYTDNCFYASLEVCEPLTELPVCEHCGVRKIDDEDKLNEEGDNHRLECPLWKKP